MAAVLLAITPKPQYNLFMMCMLVMNWGVAYVDTLAEGISAMITKYNEKIEVLEAMDGKEEEGDSSMTAFGNYNAIRFMFRAIMGLVGGFMAGKVTINVSAAIMGIYPVVMLLFTLLIFKEEKVILEIDNNNRKKCFSQVASISKKA
jgi:hypothetical protein